MSFGIRTHRVDDHDMPDPIGRTVISWKDTITQTVSGWLDHDHASNVRRIADVCSGVVGETLKHYHILASECPQALSPYFKLWRLFEV